VPGWCLHYSLHYIYGDKGQADLTISEGTTISMNKKE